MLQSVQNDGSHSTSANFTSILPHHLGTGCCSAEAEFQYQMLCRTFNVKNTAVKSENWRWLWKAKMDMKQKQWCRLVNAALTSHS